MPRSKKNADAESVLGQGPDVAATAAQTAVDGPTVAVPANLPDTAATRTVWAALSAHPGATAADLAEAAGVNRSSASKALAAMEEAGCARRTAGGREGGKRLPDRWQAVEEPTAADEAAPEPGVAEGQGKADVQDAVPGAEAAGVESPPDAGPVADSLAEDQPAVAVSAGGSGRLRPGALREMVIEYLRQRPDQDLSPSAIGKVLDRSAGAVANICGSSDTSEDVRLPVADVSKTLTELEASGLVVRVPGAEADGGKWRSAPEPMGERADVPKAGGGVAQSARLRPGELRARVLEHLLAQPGVEFSPTAVARALDASSGAVSNALERLVELGEVVRRSDKPRRFATKAVTSGRKRA